MSGWLKSLREAGEKATPGDWHIVGPPWNEGAPYLNAGSEDPHGGEFVCDFVAWHDDGQEASNSENNAEFIALARNHWDALLDIAAAAEEYGKEWDDAIERLELPDGWPLNGVLRLSRALAVLRADTGNGDNT